MPTAALLCALSHAGTDEYYKGVAFGLVALVCVLGVAIIGGVALAWTRSQENLKPAAYTSSATAPVENPVAANRRSVDKSAM